MIDNNCRDLLMMDEKIKTFTKEELIIHKNFIKKALLLSDKHLELLNELSSNDFLDSKEWIFMGIESIEKYKKLINLIDKELIKIDSLD